MRLFYFTAEVMNRVTKGADLMSLAEKGKVGVGRANSSASSSCSTTSGEDETNSVRRRDSTNKHYVKQSSVDEEVTPLVPQNNSHDVCIILN